MPRRSGGYKSGTMSASELLNIPESLKQPPTQGHVHKFGPLQFGKQLGPAHYEAIHDPCSCGLTHEVFLEQRLRETISYATAWKAAMAEERIPDDVAQRVANRALWGHPDGLFAEEKRDG